MLAKKEILQILKSYNIYSQKYEPTIYENENTVGIALDLKDSLFGYLTRIFIFQTKTELDQFLKAFIWYKSNQKKYNIKLTLDDYTKKDPHIIYKYKDQVLKLEDMLNIDDYIKENNLAQKKEVEKKIYIENIKELTNYLIKKKQEKEDIKQTKNKLKQEENDLKFALLNELTIYYGRKKNISKKQISIDAPNQLNPNSLLEKLKTLENKTNDELKLELSTLINQIKQEELDEKNLVNIYSNQIYQYNISILNKQIDFVKSKINAEKNFNLKGSKLHNIDEELRSFLKPDIVPKKIDEFIKENREIIEKKFKIDNLKEASKIITGKNISNNTLSQPTEKNLLNEWNELTDKVKRSLILYHSIYKPICNEIINHNDYEVDHIITKFSLNQDYQELEEIVYHENNNHYLLHYFKDIDFKNITSYLNSIINICHDLKTVNFSTSSFLTLFSSDNKDQYKQLSTLPLKNSKYLVSIKNQIIYIPEKLEIDYENKEISCLKEDAYYTKGYIIEEIDTIKLAKYKKKNIEKDGIIITTDLILEEILTFNKSHIEGDNYE